MIFFQRKLKKLLHLPYWHAYAFFVQESVGAHPVSNRVLKLCTNFIFVACQHHTVYNQNKRFVDRHDNGSSMDYRTFDNCRCLLL